MFFTPTIGVGGYPGWLVLERSRERQQEVFDRSPEISRNVDYFRQNIGSALTAEALVTDRRLLTVALGAFGLSEEIGKRAFIRRVLEEGTERSDAFANRLNEPRYRAMAEAFGYGDIIQGSSVLLRSFQEDLIARYKSAEFERAVGETDPDMRLALNFKSAIGAIATADNVDRVGWFQIMGQRPLRELLATALGVPSSAAQLDIDQQREIFRDRARRLFGNDSPSVFADSANIDVAIRRFFLFRQIENGPGAQTGGAAALTLLQNTSGLQGAALTNLLLSQS